MLGFRGSVCRNRLAHQPPLLCALPGRAGHCLLLFAHKALYSRGPVLSRSGTGCRADRSLARRHRKFRLAAACAWGVGALLGGRIRYHLRDAGFGSRQARRFAFDGGLARNLASPRSGHPAARRGVGGVPIFWSAGAARVRFISSGSASSARVSSTNMFWRARAPSPQSIRPSFKSTLPSAPSSS